MQLVSLEAVLPCPPATDTKHGSDAVAHFQSAADALNEAIAALEDGSAGADVARRLFEADYKFAAGVRSLNSHIATANNIGRA